jgi:hypothetical protein
MRIALLATAAAALLAAPAAAQAQPAPAPANTTPFRCPDTIQVAEQPDAPAGFNAEAGRMEHRFLQAAFFDGPQNDRSGSLAPSSETRRGNVVTQVFTFANPRQRQPYVVCHYRDTQAALVGDLPAGVSTCTLIFAYNARTGAVGTPRRPELMQCR